MLALEYSVRPLGYLTCRWLRWFWPGCLYSRLNGIRLREMPEPALPGDDWVRVRTRLAGLCGTDLAILDQKQPVDSILQAFSSLPMVLGHENVAEVVACGPAVDAAWLGRRVCVEPTLSCRPRGIDPPCDRCGEGEYGACENFGADGVGAAKLPPGTSIGYNARTGGAYGEFFVAHESQLVPVPEDLSDEQAVLTDPLACSVHGVLRADLSEASKVLVYGAGVLGLGVVAGLRAAGYTGEIDALGRSAVSGNLAGPFGATEFLRLPCDRRERFERIARRTGPTVQRARFGNLMLSGGYDVVFDCVGSAGSITESLKWTRARGQVVLIGTGHGGRIDLTPLWFRELSMIGIYGRQDEHVAGRRVGTYSLVHEWMSAGKLDVGAMLTHTFPLADWKTAFAVAMNKSPHGAMKVVLDLRDGAGAA